MGVDYDAYLRVGYHLNEREYLEKVLKIDPDDNGTPFDNAEDVADILGLEMTPYGNHYSSRDVIHYFFAIGKIPKKSIGYSENISITDLQLEGLKEKIEIVENKMKGFGLTIPELQVSSLLSIH